MSEITGIEKGEREGNGSLKKRKGPVILRSGEDAGHGERQVSTFL